jgi:uncharacterized protein
VEKLSDLTPGMVLEGVVTNVAAFGAFVDIGVHQDGLVHVSALANRFVSDPREVVKSGDVVRVKVLSVDEARKRISLTLRLDDEVDASGRPDRGRGREQAGAQDRQGGGGQLGAGRQGGGQPGAQPGGQPGGQRRGQSGQRGGQGGQGGSDRGRGGRGAPAPTGAMADALRRAGLDPSGR